jgi:hypothetical protein
VFDAERAEESVEVFGFLDIGLTYDDERVEIHFAFLKESDRIHDLAPGAVAGFVDAIEVMHFFGAVYGDSEQPFVLQEEIAPCVVKQQGVGLQGV